MNKRFICIGIIIIELLFVVFLGRKAFQPETCIDTTMEQWQSSSFKLRDDGWYMTDEYREGDRTADLVGPFITLGEGSYVARISYKADFDGTVVVNTGSDTAYRLITRKATLPAKAHNIDIEFETKGTVENIGIGIFYGNSGELTVNDISLYKTNEREKRHLFEAIVLIIFMNVFYMLRKSIYENRKMLATILGISVFSSVVLMSYGHGFGHDLEFHLMRIEGIKEELLAGHFPVKLQSIWNYGYGYPVSIYYGDVLLYFPAILRMCGVHLIVAYKIYVFCINLATAAISYYVGKKIWKKDNIAALFSAAYTLSTYRIVCLYVRSALGEYTAMLFFPLIIFGIYEIYFNRNDDNINISGIVSLTIGMIGIITCHILSTEMVAVVLCIFAILFWKTTFKKSVFFSVAISAVVSLMSTVWFLIPFLDYYKNVDVNVNQVVSNGLKIQEQGAYITQFFAVFKTHFGGRSEYITMRSSITPGLVLMLVLFVIVFLWVNGKATQAMKKVIVATLVLFFVASNVFPWNWISENKIGNLLAQIQFPYRYVGFICILLAIALGMLVQFLDENTRNLEKKLVYGIIGILFCIQIFFDISSYANDAVSIYNPLYVTDLSGQNITEYFRAGCDHEKLTGEVCGDAVESAELLSNKGTDYVFEIKTKSAGKVTLPILNYKGYRVKDEQGNSYRISDGEQKEICIKLPTNFAGKLYVDFVEPFYWRASEIISLVSVLIFIWGIVTFRRRKTKE